MSEEKSNAPVGYVSIGEDLMELDLQVGYDQNGYVALLIGDEKDPVGIITMSPGAASRVAQGLVICASRAAGGAPWLALEDDDEEGASTERAH